jgi:hypothetical protein
MKCQGQIYEDGVYKPCPESLCDDCVFKQVNDKLILCDVCKCTIKKLLFQLYNLSHLTFMQKRLIVQKLNKCYNINDFIVCQGKKIGNRPSMQCTEYICYDCASKQSKNKKILCDGCTESMNKLFSDMNKPNLTFCEKTNIYREIRMLYGFEVSSGLNNSWD